MIDVALKVGELTGGMAEGSIATYQTDDEPFSDHMKTVFALLRVGEDQLPLIEEAFAHARRTPRRFRIPLCALACALSRPQLELAWRSRKAVEPVDVSRLDLRKLMRRGRYVGKPKHKDLNAVSSGIYTVGKKADYSDWNAVCADIGTSISGELRFIQISPLSYSMNGDTPIIVMSAGGKITFESASPLQGNGGCGLSIEDTSDVSYGMDIRAYTLLNDGDGEIEIKNLYFIVAGSPGNGYSFIRLDRGGVYPHTPLFKVHDCIFDGNGNKRMGLRLDTANRVQAQIWNCKFLDCDGFGAVDGAIRHNIPQDGVSFIENCIFRNCVQGIKNSEVDRCKVNNCLSYGSTVDDFAIFGGQDGSDGDNNVSGDNTATEFDGASNIGNISTPSLDAEFAQVSTPEDAGFFRLKQDASILPTAGRAPEIPDNIVGAIGNARPGTDDLYSIGADELTELFPTGWDVYTILTINSEKISGSTPYTMPVLITERAFMITDEVWRNSREDGGDLRLSDPSDPANTLPLEVVTWDKVNHKCELWAAVEVDPTADKEYWLWAGNAHAAQPEANDVSTEHQGRWRVWGDPGASDFDQGFVYHCANPASEKYLFDSSPAKMHGPVHSVALDQQDGMFGYGKQLYFIEIAMNQYVDYGANLYEITDSAVNGYALVHYKNLNSGNTATMIYLGVNSGTDPRFKMADVDSGGSPGLYIYARAGDGVSTESLASSLEPRDGQPHVLGARVELGAKKMAAWMDGTKVEQTGYNFPGGAWSSDTHQDADVGRDPGPPASSWYMQEIRFWTSDKFGNGASDDFWSTHAAMIEDLTAFWSCAPLYGQAQEGPRKWHFLVPEVGCFGVENTDFWIEYAANLDGTLSVILHAVWDAGSGDALTSVDKRVELEARLEELRHTFETLRGDLLVDEGTSWEKLVRGVQLSSVSVKEGKTNAALDYDLTFVIGLAGLGMRSIARTLEFDNDVLNAGNFLVEYVGVDRTVFKEIFRAAPIRIPSGPVNKNIFVTAIISSIEAATPLARRQRAEAILKEWAWDRLGTEGELKIDGVLLGTAHLAGVQPTQLELPDAVVFDLEFITGYGS